MQCGCAPDQHRARVLHASDSFMFNDQLSLKKEFCPQLVMAGEQGAHKCPVEPLAGRAAGKR